MEGFRVEKREGFRCALIGCWPLAVEGLTRIRAFCVLGVRIWLSLTGPELIPKSRRLLVNIRYWPSGLIVMEATVQLPRLSLVIAVWLPASLTYSQLASWFYSR